MAAACRGFGRRFLQGRSGSAERTSQVKVGVCNLCGHMEFKALIRKDGYDVVRCMSCELVLVGNPPGDEQLARLYSFESGYHRGLEVDGVATAFHEREAAKNLQLLQRHARKGRLLDIGCSTGQFLSAARQIGWVGQGLEYSPDSSRVARELRGLDVKTGVLSADTYPPDNFDVITLWDVIEHLPDPCGTMRHIARILAPGGLLVLKTPNVDGMYPRASLRIAKVLGFWGHAEPPGHLFQFSAKTLTLAVQQAELEVVSVHQQRIPISYSFGAPKQWFRSAKWAAYCALFVPMAILGPVLASGDDITLVCRKPA